MTPSAPAPPPTPPPASLPASGVSSPPGLRHLPWLGVLLVVGSSLAGSGGSLLALPFAAWASAPWAVLLAAGRIGVPPWISAGATVAGLAVELGVRLAVFVFPAGSTAAIALVFSPLAVAVAMAVGAGAGWAAQWSWPRTGVPGRLAIGAAAVLATTWLVVALARPDLLPTARVARQRALEAIGPPRVALGGSDWTATTVHEGAFWAVAADLDGDGRDDLATIDGAAIAIRASGSTAVPGAAHAVPPVSVRATLAVPSMWSWYSRLARLGSEIVVVQTGGGYQETAVATLDGRELWRYRPDPALPPTALTAADLDGDGVTEFYATTTAGTVRLDASGRDVWRRDGRPDGLLGTLPASPLGPALVATTEYGRAIRLWTPEGHPYADLPWPEGRPLALGDGPGGRVVLVADPDCGDTRRPCRLRALGFDHRERLVAGLPPAMQVVDARLLRTGAPGDPHVVMTTAAPRGVDRGGLRVIDATGAVRYDEVLTAVPRLVVARGTPSGVDTLYVHDGDRLRQLAPVAPHAR